MKNECACCDLTFCKEHTNSGHSIVEYLVVCPPRLLNVHCGRIVSLSDTAVRVTLKVLAHKVDTSYHHPFVVSLKLVVTYVVAAKSECFRKDLLLTCLSCSGCNLMMSKAGEYGSTKPVHTGDCKILVVRHTSAVCDELGVEIFFKNQVTCELKVALTAPVVNLLHEVFREELCYKLPELHSGLNEVFFLNEELGKNIVNFLTVSLLIHFGKSQAPGEAVSGNLRLVSEEAVKCGAELLVVGNVNFVNKVCDYFS